MLTNLKLEICNTNHDVLLKKNTLKLLLIIIII